MLRSPNSVQHTIDIFQDFVIPKPQYAEAFFFQGSCARQIIFNSVGVLSAVNLNNQVCLQADKIHNVNADVVLPPELKPSTFFSRMCCQRRRSASVIPLRRERANSTLVATLLPPS